MVTTTIINQLVAESDEMIEKVYPAIDRTLYEAKEKGDIEGMKQAIRDIQTANNRMAEINRMLKSCEGS